MRIRHLIRFKATHSFLVCLALLTTVCICLSFTRRNLAKAGFKEASTTPTENLYVDMSQRNWTYKTYPVGGTGIHMNIPDSFDARIINSFCRTDGNLRAIVPIYSAVDRLWIRNILRNTLGKWAEKLNCKILFITGMSMNRTLNSLLRHEYNREKDILIMDKMDAYRDLNDKAFLMVEWISKYCLHVPYVIHLIDDAFVNLEMFINRLESIKDKNYILGGILYNRPPRDKVLNAKTFLTQKEYPYNEHPPYAIGFAYAFPTNVSQQLLSAAHKARYCWIEDIWLTGLVRDTAGVDVISLKQRKEWLAEEDKKYAPAGLFKGLPKYYFIHSMQPEDFYWLYSSVST